MPGRILIVDDDAAARECYGRLFRRNGYEPCLAASGAWVEANPEMLSEVEVVLLDLRMPGMSGLELLSRLRRRGFAGLAILVTAHAEAEISHEAKRLGVRRVFNKPVQSAALLEAVAEAFTRTRRKAEEVSSPSEALT
ncbi:MAG TPA: response regulator [Candidatus Polarisedimenticolia bacterium]|nr:response regulator [Candidatus Polarisedimenticolia bacterium]